MFDLEFRRDKPCQAVDREMAYDVLVSSLREQGRLEGARVTALRALAATNSDIFRAHLEQIGKG